MFELVPVPTPSCLCLPSVNLSPPLRTTPSSLPRPTAEQQGVHMLTSHKHSASACPNTHVTWLSATGHWKTHSSETRGLSSQQASERGRKTIRDLKRNGVGQRAGTERDEEEGKYWCDSGDEAVKRARGKKQKEQNRSGCNVFPEKARDREQALSSSSAFSHWNVPRLVFLLQKTTIISISAQPIWKSLLCFSFPSTFTQLTLHCHGNDVTVSHLHISLLLNTAKKEHGRVCKRERGRGRERGREDEAESALFPWKQTGGLPNPHWFSTGWNQLVTHNAWSQQSLCF